MMRATEKLALIEQLEELIDEEKNVKTGSPEHRILLKKIITLETSLDTSLSAEEIATTPAVTADAGVIFERLKTALLPQKSKSKSVLENALREIIVEFLEKGKDTATITAKMVRNRASHQSAGVEGLLLLWSKKHPELKLFKKHISKSQHAVVAIFEPLKPTDDWVLYLKIHADEQAKALSGSRKEIEESYAAASSGSKIRTPERFSHPADYLTLAKDFLSNIGGGAQREAAIPQHLAFVLAVTALATRSNKVTAESKCEVFSRIIASIGNPKILDMSRGDYRKKGNQLNFRLAAEELVDKLRRPLRGESFTLWGFLDARINPIVKGLNKIEEVLKSKDGVYAHLAKAIDERAKELSEDEFSQEEHHVALTLPDIRALLDWTSGKHGDFGFYLYIVLGLSTCLRPEELEALCKEHLNKDGTLNYGKPFFKRGKHESIALARKKRRSNVADKDTLTQNDVDNFYLVNKTKDKVASDKPFANPSTSVATRIILKHYAFHHPKTGLYADFWDLGGKAREEIYVTESARDNGYIRCLRTTSATFLYESQLSNIGKRLMAREVQLRGAWANAEMLDTVYARNKPTSDIKRSFDEFLGIAPIRIPTKENHVAQHFDFGFDHYLLEHLIHAFRTQRPSEYAKLKTYIAEEILETPAYLPAPRDL